MDRNDNRDINYYQYQRALRQDDFDWFATLTGDNNPIHVDPHFARNSKFGRTVAHGMMLYGLVSRGLSEHFPGMVQSSMEMIFPNPTFAEERLTITLTVVPDHLKDGITHVEPTISQPSGLASLEGQTKLVDLNAGFYPNDPSSAHFRSVGESAGELKGLTYGQRASTHRVFTARDVEDYSSITGDRNPLYDDDDSARRYGFLGRLVPNALLGGMVSDLLGTRLPGRGTNWLKQRFDFHQPVYLAEDVHASVEIIRLRPEKDLVDLRVVISTEQRGVAINGRSLVLVKDLESIGG